MISIHGRKRHARQNMRRCLSDENREDLGAGACLRLNAGEASAGPPRGPAHSWAAARDTLATSDCERSRAGKTGQPTALPEAGHLHARSRVALPRLLGQVVRPLGRRSCESESGVDPVALHDARLRVYLTQHELARLIDVAGGERISLGAGRLPTRRKASSTTQGSSKCGPVGARQERHLRPR